MGGLTAGITSRLRGGSFRQAFLDGMIGGGAIYAGKRIAAERFAGAGLLGRETAALGVSIIHNAGAGAGLLDRLVFPVGPLRVHIDRTAGPSLNVRLDAIALGWIAWAVSEPELHFDAGDSFSAGTAIFRTRDKVLRFGSDSVHAAGVTAAGVAFVADVPGFGPDFPGRALAHERVHVLQMDHISQLWIDPLVMAATRGVPWLSAVSRHVEINLSTELLRALGGFFPEHDERPWEIEAIFFARD
jgi:hypothetical protein